MSFRHKPCVDHKRTVNKLKRKSKSRKPHECDDLPTFVFCTLGRANDALVSFNSIKGLVAVTPDFFDKEQQWWVPNVPVKPKSDACLIFDLHGVLIDEDTDKLLPEAKEMLTVAFEHCKHVAIWTAAGREFLDDIHSQLLVPLLPPGKSFDFLWSGEKCTRRANKEIVEGVHSKIQPVKRLKKVYRNKERRARGWTKQNTYIVDDTEFTYTDNKSKAIDPNKVDVIASIKAL